MLPVLHTASGDLAVPAITWVDDVAIYLESADARDLLPTAKEVVQAMHQQCRMVGLDLMHGKTEKCCFDYMDVTLTPFDEICTKLAQWLLDLVIGIKFGYLLPRDIRTLVLNILQTCPLMSSLDTDWQGLGKHSLIVGSAFYKMMQSTRKPGGLSHAVLSYPGYSLVVKSGPRLQLLNFRSASNFFSKLQGWSSSKRTLCWNGALNGWFNWSSLAGAGNHYGFANCRLRYAARLYRHAPNILVTLLHQIEALDGDSWIQRLQQDIEWLQQRTPGLSRLLPPHLDFAAWIDLMKHARDWAAMVQRAFQADTLKRFTLARYQVWRLQFRQGLVQAGAHFPVQISAQRHAAEMTWRCLDCGQSFHTQKALSVHKYKKHSQHALARSYMDSSVCGHCLKDYHTIQRLRQHLQYPRGCCLAALQQVWWPVDALNLQSFRPGIDIKAAHRVPAIQCFGPKLPTRQQWLTAKPDKIMPHLIESTAEEAVEEEPHNEAPNEENEIPNVVCIELLASMEAYAERCNASDEDQEPPDLPQLLQPDSFATISAFSRCLQEELVHQMDFTAYLQVYGWVEGLLGQHFAQQRVPLPRQAHDPKPPAKTAPAVAPSRPTWLSDHDVMPRFSPVIERQPRRVGSTRYILYLYSGHRREGDMIEWAHTLGSQRDMAVEVISLDIVYDAKLCDMRDPQSRAVWMGYVRSGFFLGVVGAPPCETYSAARMRAITEQDGGPPPLRSVAEPWGLSTLTLKQQRQVLVSNDLMQGWLMFFITAYSTGTAVLMEHPAESSRHPEAASIWRTAELHMIDQMQNTKRHMVIQGLYGAVSAKPTTFAVGHIPRFAQILKAWVAPDAAIRARSWIRLEGKNHDGTWKTAQGKAYPSRLNAALIDCMLQGSLCAEELEMTADFREHTRVVITAQQTSGSVMGPDYAANSVPIWLSWFASFALGFCLCTEALNAWI